MARRTRDENPDRDPKGRDEAATSVDFDAPTLRMSGGFMDDEEADTDPAPTAGLFEQDHLEFELNFEAIDPGLLPAANFTGTTALEPPLYVARSGAFPTGHSPEPPAHGPTPHPTVGSFRRGRVRSGKVSRRH